jgi:uncharacterized protein
MTDEVVEKCLNLLGDQFHENVIFNFFGGEPMLMEDFSLKWMYRLRERFPKCRFHFTTNGTIYSERLVKEWLISEPSILQISHDGINQSKLRGMEDIVTKNLKLYLSEISPEKVTARLTFNHETVGDLYANVQYFYGLGVRRFAHQADVTNLWTKENNVEYERQLDKVYQFIDNHGDFDVIFCNCNRMTGSHMQDRQCSMGRGLLSLSADGSIYPCHRAVKFKQFKIGDVYSGKINRGKFPVLKMDGCSQCDAKFICHQCFLANYEQNGFLETPVESGCDINKYEFKKLSDKFKLTSPGSDYIERIVPSISNVLGDIKSNNNEILALMA